MTHYNMQISHANSLNNVLMYCIFFCIIQYKVQMAEEGWTEDNDSQHFIFKDDYITLEIPESPPVIVDGWEIIPCSTPLEVYIKMCAIDLQVI